MIVVKREMNEVIDIEQKLMGKKVKKDSLPLAHFQKNEKHEFKIDDWIESQASLDISIIEYTEFKINSKEQIEQLIYFLQQ